jgi:hypothetical protein
VTGAAVLGHQLVKHAKEGHIDIKKTNGWAITYTKDEKEEDKKE